MNDLQKYLCRCLLLTAALLGGAFPACADEAATAALPQASSLAAAVSLLSGMLSPAQSECNQGVGNGAEDCDPGNSNHERNTNDEAGGVAGSPGRQGGNK